MGNLILKVLIVLTILVSGCAEQPIGEHTYNQDNAKLMEGTKETGLSKQVEEKEFERNYPSKIKTAFVKNLGMVPPWERNNVLLKENLLAKERLGINTYHTFTCYMYTNGQFKSCDSSFEEMYKTSADEISAVKKAGLAVDFGPSWSVGTGTSLADREDLERFLEEYKKTLIKDAEFAEKYKVEYFWLNEPDHLISEQSFYVSEDDKVEIINEYKEDIVPKIRAVYGGKIYYQIGDAGEWDFTKLNVSGLDYFGVLIGGTCNFDEFKRKVDIVFDRAENLSERSDIPWAISELWINKKYEEGEFCDLSGKRNPYYQYVFEKAKSSKNLVGIMVDTWNVDEPGFETSVKDTQAEQVIQEFFEEWQ